MIEQLKPCPFCNTNDLLGFEQSYEGGWAIVKCRRCGCSGAGRATSEHEAALWWNQRPQAADTKARLTDLAAGIEDALRKFEGGHLTIFEAMAAIAAAGSQYKAAGAEVSRG